MNRNNDNRMKKIKVISYQTIQSKYRSGSAEPRRKVENKSRNNTSRLHKDRNHSFEEHSRDSRNAKDNDKLSSNKKKLGSNKKEEKKPNTNKKNTKIKTLENSSKKKYYNIYDENKKR
jgi:hypothetical protein